MFKNLRLSAGKLLLAASLLGGSLIAVAVASADGGNCTLSGSTTDVCLDGSTTVYPVVADSRYRFPADFPGTTIEEGVFPGSGSGTGQSKIFAHVVDIGMSSSGCSVSNRGANGQPAVPGIDTCGNLQDTVFARDALTIIANKNFVNTTCGVPGQPTLTKLEVEKIYEGLITTWGQIAAFAGKPCAGTTIVPRARIVGSGTRASFLKLAVICATDADSGGACQTGGNFENNVIGATGLARLQGNPEVEAAIDSNPGQMGYIGLAFTDANNVQFCLDFGSGSVCPSVATVNNLTYGMARNLHLFTIAAGTVYTDGTGTHTFVQKSIVTSYLNWILGPEGQQIVQQVGYVTVGAVQPPWDLNNDGAVDIIDFSAVGNFWAHNAPASGDISDPLIRGWVSADVNWDGTIDILDFATMGNHWTG